MFHNKPHSESNQNEPTEPKDNHKLEGRDKTQVTLYISPDVHKKLKITSAVTSVYMSTLAEKAIEFYLEHGDIIETSGYGHTHRLHQCPECHHPLVFREGNLTKVPTASTIDKSRVTNEGDLILR